MAAGTELKMGSGKCDIPVQVSCPLCDNLNTRLLLDSIWELGKPYTISLCEKCSIGFTVPFPSPKERAILYSAGIYRQGEGKRFIGPVEIAVYLARHLRRKRIEKYRKKGSILDIGCGRGLFLNIMKKHGWMVAGTEYDQFTADSILRKYDIEIKTGSPKEWGFPHQSFDVITMSHVMEHMDAPWETLDECAKILKPGGYLFVAVPNLSSLQAHCGKQHWFHLDVPHHLFHFTEEGLSDFLHKYGFKVFKVRRFDMEYIIFGWLQTLLNLSRLRKNLLFNILKGGKTVRKQYDTLPWKDLMITFIFVPILLPASFLLSLWEIYGLKRGGTIEIYATRA